MNPAKAIAVEGVIVVNANLYFFSWMSFAVCIFLIGSLAQELFGIDARQAPPKTSRWFALCVSSLVVMGTAARIFKADEFDCGNPDSEYSDTSFCRRTKLAIAFGVVSCVFSGAMAVMSQYGLLTILIEMGTATLLLIIWCFGVGTSSTSLCPLRCRPSLVLNLLAFASRLLLLVHKRVHYIWRGISG